MCGILFTDSEDISKERFLQALNLMDYRGPDASGYLEFKNFKLGSRRLKVIDLDDRANQPFETDEYAIIFNGEIYNYRKLKSRHLSDRRFRTESDTEVLLEMFGHRGHAMFEHLNGMFSLVILNKNTEEVTIARDRLGVKPLYYCRAPFVLSSEIAPILYLTKGAKIDEIGRRQYLKMRGFFNGRTLYKNIQMWQAAHFSTEIRYPYPQRFYRLPFSHSIEPSAEQLRETIINAVKCRLISDVPVATFLSGGLDSTIVSAIAHRYLPDLHTYSISVCGNGERDFAVLAAGHIGSKHTHVEIGREEFITTARFMIRKRLEPLCVPNEVLIYLLARRMKQDGFTVALSGDCADEFFLGYDRIFRWAGENRWDTKKFDELYGYNIGDDLVTLLEAVKPDYRKKNCIESVMQFFQTGHLQGLLRRLDFASMLASVEVRSPFCDYRVVDLAGRFHWQRRLNPPKGLLKEAFGSILPEETVNRPKMGFPVDLKILGFQNGYIDWLKWNLAVLAESTPEQQTLETGLSS